jgi:uncharacterized protein (TIGR02145 family)
MKVLGVVALLFAATVVVDAQTSIVGTWELVTRTVSRPDGTTIVDPVLGERPTGRLIYDATGRMSLQMMRADRKSAISTPADARNEANPRVILGYDSYFGRYTVDEKAGTVTHHVEGSLFPEDLGSNWVRPFTLKGDTLTLRFTSPNDGITRTLVFRRLAAGSNVPSKQMADGRAWTTTNLNVALDGSYCYDGADQNCDRYGRLYTWEAAHRGCQSLGDGWRLPTNDEWRQLAKAYGGLMEESEAGGRAAYGALREGGGSGFNAVLGGSRIADEYSRIEAHGLYWTASETGATSAWFYNLGKGGASVNRHRGGDKQMAVSARCVRP